MGAARGCALARVALMLTARAGSACALAWSFSRLAVATRSAPPSASATAAAFARARLALLRTARRRIAARQAERRQTAVTTTVPYDRCEGDGGGRPVAADLEMVATVAASEGRLQPHSGEKERR